jgi:hypothetical protein
MKLQPTLWAVVRAARPLGFTVQLGDKAGTYKIKSPGASRPSKSGNASACIAWLASK